MGTRILYHLLLFVIIVCDRFYHASTMSVVQVILSDLNLRNGDSSPDFSTAFSANVTDA